MTYLRDKIVHKYVLRILPEYQFQNPLLLSRNTDGRSGNDKSFKPVDTVNNSSLEQESVIASGLTTCHTGKSSALAE